MKDMNFSEFQELALRTFNHQSEQVDQLHIVLGLVTESGEVADAIKKHIGYGKELDIVNIKEEFGDLFWYLAVGCKIFGFDHNEIWNTNIEKLKTRYPDKYSDQAAIYRDLVAERTVLEG